MAAKPAREQLFAEVSAGCAPLIARIARSHEADPVLRAELIQEILAAIWVALPSWRGESSLSTYIAAIAQNRCLSHAARRAREPRQVKLPGDLVCAAPSPDEVILREDEKKRLMGAIRYLAIPQREAILLCVEGFSYVEMAAILGISVNAAMLRCRRAREKLELILDAPP
jgi:RNA polymerase sigma-70 factor (ECF subfamily)